MPQPPETAVPAGYSHAEEVFERARKRLGLVLAPVILVALLVAPLQALTPQAHRLAAIVGCVMTLWITEALPMPVSALLGAAACVLLGVAPAEKVLAPFANPLIFLFIGSFVLARALFHHRLDRRLAYGVLSLRWIGGRPGRVLFAFGAVTAFLSAWVSNTATTAMMCPIGMSIVAFLFAHEPEEGRSIRPQYATGLMLMTSFAASVGGLATPIGSAPNIIGLGYIRQMLGIDLSFFKWCLLGVPAAVCLFLYVAALLGLGCRAGVATIPAAAESLRQTRAALGPLTRGQRSTLIACGLTVALWVAPGFVALALGENDPFYRALENRMPEGIVALLGAGMLFVLPGEGGARALSWDEAVQIDWGTILLFGGGYTLGILARDTHLAEALGRGLTAALPWRGELGLLFGATLAATLVSEMTSNTASANMVVPIAIAVAQGAGVDPLEPALGAIFGSGLGFMLPVSTPPNAIVYGSGYVPLRQMIRFGLALDVASVAIVVALIRLIVPWMRY